MVNDKHKPEHCSSRDNQKKETENRVDELINAVENHTRTERHLEQHSDIAHHNRIEEAENKQEDREHQISDLKNKIVYGDSNHTNQIEGLEKNITFADGYLAHNDDHMPKEDIENLKEKQKNRVETLNRLQ